jgi:hypothetical protein
VKALLAMCLALLCPCAALAQGFLTVRVVNAQNGKPVAAQTVTITGAHGDLVATTDRHGIVSFLDVPSGRTSADASGGGYVSRCRPFFDVSAGQHRILTIDVIAASPQQDTAGPFCALSDLVNPGEGADVYDIH